MKLSVSTDGDLPPGQLSPASARRRSTRASAIKAAEKIKLKDDVVAPADGSAVVRLTEECPTSYSLLIHILERRGWRT